jgi:hypothetical protein
VHPPFSLGLFRSSESLCLLLFMIGTIHHGGIELGDLLEVIVRGPSHVVSGCGRFTALKQQRISPVESTWFLHGSRGSYKL